MNETSPMYLRVYSWWMLVQNYATLRFSDHRGLNPGEVTFREGSFHAHLTRSKTIGQDKTITSKPLVIDACCFFSHRAWLTRGWSLLQGMANFPRDYLMPAPASHCQSCRKLELRYDASFAMKNRVLRMLARNGVPVFHSSSTRFWTPHSGRTFLPSATAALGFLKSERDFLGGWCAQASDRYARIAIRRITNMQRSVITALQSQAVDPLAEDESIRDSDAFMESQSLDASQRTLCYKSLDSVKLFEAPHSQEELTITTPDEPEDGIILEDTKEAFHTVQPTSKRRKGNEEARTATLGESHNWNLVTTFAFQVRRRSKHSISWASVIFFQALTILTIPTTESLFREFLLTIAFVDYALVKDLKMAETLRAKGPPQVRLLMAIDWPSDVQVPSKRVLCASAQHKRFATTLFASVPRDTFPFQGTLKHFYWGFFPSVPLLLLCVCPGLASPFCLRGLGVPGFALFLSGRWVVPCLLCLGFCVFLVFWDFSQDAWSR